jgi:predicted dehydrogenase
VARHRRQLLGFISFGTGVDVDLPLFVAHLPALAPLVKGNQAKVIGVYSRSAKTAKTFTDAGKEALHGAPDIPVYSDDSSKDYQLDALLHRSDVQAVVVVLPITVQPDIIRKVIQSTVRA